MGLEYNPEPRSMSMEAPAGQRTIADIISAMSAEVVYEPQYVTTASPRTVGPGPTVAEMISSMSTAVVREPLASSRVHPWRTANPRHPYWNADQVQTPCTVCNQVSPCPKFVVRIPFPSAPPNQ